MTENRLDNSSQMKAAVRAALEFLTDEDAERLCAIGQLTNAADRDSIIDEGSCQRRVLVLLSGRGRVIRSHLGSRITVSTVSAPTVLGEVPYFDQKGASASVISDGPTCVLAFDDAPLSSL